MNIRIKKHLSSDYVAPIRLRINIRIIFISYYVALKTHKTRYKKRKQNDKATKSSFIADYYILSLSKRKEKSYESL